MTDPAPGWDPVVTADAAVPDGLLDAVEGYERALMADDVEALDGFFAPGPHTLRGDAAGLLVGSDAIAAFRRGRGGAPARRVPELHVRGIGQGDALVVAVTAPAAGGRGQQTQLWHRTDDGWRITAAHVAASPPAIDQRVWRVVGAPLVRGDRNERAPLAGVRVAVKDLFAVAGQRVGAGVPAWLDEAPVERESAPAVRQLLDAGADAVGLAQTDEFAYSIAGLNPHYGVPPNPAVPGGMPGGSSSGPASAVALGQADVGLGTDTGGSVRVPASYQGLWGLRTTHGAVPVGGLLPLAPSFDTVGWLTRDLALMRRVAAVGLPASTARPARRLAVDPALLELVAPEVRDAFLRVVTRLAGGEPEAVRVGDVEEVFEAFRTVQAFEAWQAHGPWLAAHPDAVRGAVAERFVLASKVTPDASARARVLVAEGRARLRGLLSYVTLLLPAASGPAPSATATPGEIDRARFGTLRLTAVAGTAGAPALAAPLLQTKHGPVGISFVAAPGADAGLLDLVQDLLADDG